MSDAERGARLAGLRRRVRRGAICAGPLVLYEATRFLGGQGDSARGLRSTAPATARRWRRLRRKRIERAVYSLLPFD